MLVLRRVAIVVAVLGGSLLLPACQQVSPCASVDTAEVRRAVLVLATRDMRCSADQITMSDTPLAGKVQANLVTHGCGFQAAYQCNFEVVSCRATTTNCTFRGCARDGATTPPDQPFCP